MHRFDLITGRKSKDGQKTYWTKVGVAFANDRGGYSIELEAYPLPDAEGKVRMLMVEPRQASTEATGGNSRRGSGNAPAGRPDLADDIPFAPSVL